VLKSSYCLFLPRRAYQRTNGESDSFIAAAQPDEPTSATASRFPLGKTSSTAYGAAVAESKAA
jgi:hypothetical protein